MFQFTEPHCTINKRTPETHLCNLTSAQLLNAVYLISHLIKSCSWLQFVISSSPNSSEKHRHMTCAYCLLWGRLSSLVDGLHCCTIKKWVLTSLEVSCLLSQLLQEQEAGLKKKKKKDMLVAVCLSELFVQWPDPLPPPEKMQRCSSPAPPQHPGTARDCMQYSHTFYGAYLWLQSLYIRLWLPWAPKLLWDLSLNFLFL